MPSYDLIVIGAFTIIRVIWPAVTPDVGSLIRDPNAYLRGAGGHPSHYGQVTLWAFGMLALNGLPQLYHPLFNAPNFRDGATTDKFFLCLEALDPKFDAVESKDYLKQFDPVSIVEVEY